MSAPNSKFAEAVTSTAFNLTLSKTMIARLISVANGDVPSTVRIYPAMGFNNLAVPAGQALKRRGLVYAPDPELPGAYKLTRAGELAVEMLREAGIAQTYEEALEAA